MKQMNKEELIEYFIEQLGNNEILGKVMSIDQIRNKLNYVIKDVTYNDEEEIKCAGHCQIGKDGKVTINFDVKHIIEKEEKETIVHELLHALSTRTASLKVDYSPYGNKYEVRTENCGLQQVESRYYSEDTKIGIEHNTAINEGITDALAEKITGINHDGYKTEKDIYRIISVIIDEDIMIEKYLSEDVHQIDNINVFENEIVNKYGQDLGKEINDDLKKVFTLSDQLLNLNMNDVVYGLNSNGMELQSKFKDEIYSTLENMVYKIIEHEPDAMMRIQGILEPISQTSLRDKVATKILGDIANNNEFDIETKLAFLNYAQEGKAKYYYVLKPIVEKLLESFEADELSSEDKLSRYLELCGNYCDKKRIYDLCVNSGMISNEEFEKSSVFFDKINLFNNQTPEEIKQRLLEISYRKVGNNFEIYDSNTSERKFIKSDGKTMTNDCEYIKGTLCSERINSSFFREEGLMIDYLDVSDILTQNIRMEIKELEDTRQKCKIFIECYDNMIILQNIYDNLKEKNRLQIYYSVNPDGSLEKIEPRCRKKIYR